MWLQRGRQCLECNAPITGPPGTTSDITMVRPPRCGECNATITGAPRIATNGDGRNAISTTGNDALPVGDDGCNLPPILRPETQTKTGDVSVSARTGQVTSAVANDDGIAQLEQVVIATTTTAFATTTAQPVLNAAQTVGSDQAAWVVESMEPQGTVLPMLQMIRVAQGMEPQGTVLPGSDAYASDQGTAPLESGVTMHGGRPLEHSSSQDLGDQKRRKCDAMQQTDVGGE